MGCWSEACALSGIEITDGLEVYVALVVPSDGYNNSGQWDLSMPPIKGKYDDYGGLDLLEDTPYGPKNGENWRPENEIQGAKPKDGLPIYIDAELFESLENLPREFPYFGTHINGKYEMIKGVKTIGQARDLFLKDVRAAIAKSIEKKNKWDSLKGKPDVDRSILYNQPIHELLGYPESGSILVGASHYLTERIEQGQTDFEEFLKFFGRAYVLFSAQFELRKLVAPGIRGPQQGGDPALIQFTKEVLRLSEERKRKWDEEFGEDED